MYRDSGCNDFLGNTPLRHQEACVSDLDETSFSASRIMCARSTSIPVKYPSIITSLQHNKTYCTSKSNEFASIRTGVCHEEIVGDQSFQMQCDSKSFSRTTFAGKGKCEGRAYEHEKELTACASYSQVLSASVTTTTNSTVFPKKRKISEVAAKVGSASVVHHSEPSVAKVVSQSDRDALLICDPFSLDDNSQTGFELCKFEACGGENIIISTSHHIGAFCSGDVTMELFHDEDDTLVASNDNYFGKCPQITVVIPDTPNICSLYTVVQACKDGENCRGQVSISRLKMDSIEDSVKRISTPFDLLNVNPFDKVDGEEMVVQKMRCDTFMKDLHTGSSTCIFEACDEKEIVISACGEEGGYCYGNAMFAVYDSALDNVGFSHEACGSCPQYRFKAAKQCQIYSIIQYCASYDDTCGGQLTVNEIQRIPRSKVQDSSLNPQIDEQNEYPRILTQAAIGSSEGCRNSFGSDYCGGYAYGSSAYSTSCYCDDACCKFGDCCSNKLEVCGGCSSSETDSKLVLQSALTTLSYATNNRRSPRTVELICGYYQASSTDSAKSNFATCSLQLCAGEAMIVSGIDSCYGDQYLRLFDEDDNQVSHNDDYAGLCSQLTHSLPATLSTTEPFCRTFTLRKGCHGASLCSGNVKVSVVPEKELSVVLFHSIFENNDKGEDIAQSMMRISCVEQVASSIYFTSGERVSFVKPQLSVNFFTGFHIESKQEYEPVEKEVYTDTLFDVAGNEFYFGFICLVALSCLLVACGFIYSRYKTSVIVPPINYRV